MKLLLQKTKLIFAIGLALLGSSVQAQPTSTNAILKQRSSLNPSKQSNAPIVFNVPPPPPDIGESGQRSEAGTRGCDGVGKQNNRGKEKLLTALVPVYGSSDSGLVWGKTVASHPTFLFFVPFTSVRPAQFILQNEAGATIYQTKVLLSGVPGVISLSLPSSATPLNIGKRYHWFFNIYCQLQQTPIFVEGWIQRDSLNPAYKHKLEATPPQDQVAFYAAHGIWYDALATSAKVRRSEPRNSNWAILLQGIGLADIVPEPEAVVFSGIRR